ncbi:hypothetical protein BO70DRAFT_146755 [Aspergillus heteromorphus CBS 117.55]|uniref:Aminoglycoside phosphotransferase domain-containing protein n=1 Tax=Aspergillus heteromorphus CBS 117.55 TaxID=1448321 RepID=A0A317V860_9EURO|nr:uncharacterized protein BO70DRAFT_146755 [Aspergillus heteromorphus CBS 117.55]PWY69491.1 hypothetical protein BO70DRAFT_146755 [Aspergillus heteromorphus CBS 117.55]
MEYLIDGQLAKSVTASALGMSTVDCSDMMDEGDSWSFAVELLDPVTPRSLRERLNRREPGILSIPQGTERVVIRFPNPRWKSDADTSNWAGQRVASMALAARALEFTEFETIVPAVYAWSEGSPHDPTFVIEEYRPELRLSDYFDGLDETRQADVLRDFAAITRYFQAYVLPWGLQGYGSLAFDANGRLTLSGSHLIPGRPGPFGNFRDCLSARAQRSWEVCEDHWSAKENWPLLSRVREFYITKNEELLDAFKDMQMTAFIHCGLDLQNVLYDPQKGKITTLMDYGRCRIDHPLFEYFNSFSSIMGKLFYPFDAHLQFLVECVLEGFPVEECPIDDLDRSYLATSENNMSKRYAVGKKFHGQLEFHDADVLTPWKTTQAKQLCYLLGIYDAMRGRCRVACGLSAAEAEEQKEEILKKYLAYYGS